MNTRPNGNNMLKSLLCFCLLLILMLQTSCGGVGDWSYDLPNNYQILRVNSNSVVFGKYEDLFERKLDRYIVSFCFNDCYIGLERIPLDDIPPDQQIDIKKFDRTNSEYYLMDSANDLLYGPYSKDDYNEQCNDLGINDMCEWIETIIKPEGAY